MENHPVVHVSWNDANAYSNWVGKDLPTEAEWEYAARGGLEQKLYSWGDDASEIYNKYIWDGNFPNQNTLDDGWLGTSPVTLNQIILIFMTHQVMFGSGVVIGFLLLITLMIEKKPAKSFRTKIWNE